MNASARATPRAAASPDPVTREIIKGALRAAQAEMEAVIERTAMSPVHPREEGLLRRHPRRARARGMRHDAAALRQPHRDHLRAVPARDHAPRRPLLVQRLPRLARRRLALARHGLRRARCSTAAGSSPSRRRGATSGTSAACGRAASRPTPPRSSTRASSCPPCGSIARACSTTRCSASSCATRASPTSCGATSARCSRAAGSASAACSSCSSASGPRPCSTPGPSSSGSAGTRSARRSSRASPTAPTRREDAVDGDGMSGHPFHVRMRLVKEGGRIVIDTRASDDQARGPINFIMHESVPKLILGIYLLSGHPTVLLNDGAQDAIDEVLVRPGSILQPRWPAALGNRAHTLARVQSSVLALLALATGGDVPAANSVYNIYFLRGVRSGDAASSSCAATGRGGLRCPAVRRRARRDLLRRAEELPRRVHGDDLPAAPAPVRAPPGLRRPRALSRRLRRDPRDRADSRTRR